MNIGSDALPRALSLCAGGVAALSGAAAIFVSGLGEREADLLLRNVGMRATELIGLALLALSIAAVCAFWLIRAFVCPISTLADQVRLALTANPARRIGISGPGPIVSLARMVDTLAVARHRQQIEFEAHVRDSNVRVESERNRLAALMAGLSEGVLLCNVDGQILLYNESARSMFGRAHGSPDAIEGLVGLGRSLFRLLDRAPVVHALDRLQFGLDMGVEFPTVTFACGGVTRALFKVRVAPYLSTAGEIAGMLLSVEDVTAPMSDEIRQRAGMRSFATAVRSPAADLCAAASSLRSLPGANEARIAKCAETIEIESRRVSGLIGDLLAGYAESQKAGIALEDLRADDLLDLARRRIEAEFGMPCDAVRQPGDLWIRGESFALVEAIACLARHLREDYGVRSVRLRAASRESQAELDLVWTGAIVSSDAVALWETQPMQLDMAHTPLTLKDVLDRHGGEVLMHADKTAQSSWFRLLLPLGTPATVALRRPPGAGSRPEFYDFDLFHWAEAGPSEQRLAELSYTVFDTETTGLEPSAGDEIISLGAVRIVNSRLLHGEVFETLIDPQRPVGKAASAIHGIESAALAGQPTISRVLPQFHRFAEDSVLVAHNAAFDMRFLELKESVSGIRFTQPVLDTLLLSAIVHPDQKGHDLESIAERFGIRVVGRHTALGDALLTGEIFLKLVPLLAERGIHTLGQALGASQDTYYARLQY